MLRLLDNMERNNKNIPYQNREIDEFFKNFGDRMTKSDSEFDKRMTHQDDVLTEIKLQTTKTNGRVNGHSLQFKIMWVIVCCAAAVIAGVGPFMYHVVLSQIQQDFKDSQAVIEQTDQQSDRAYIDDTFAQYHIIVNNK